MKFSIQFIAGMCLLLAMLGWTAVWYAGNQILEDAAARASTASSAQTQSDRAAYTRRVASLVSETRSERDVLEKVSGMNIVSIVTLIESVGARTGISVKVNNAQPQGGAVSLPGGSLSKFVFAIEADGSFAQIMRTVQSLEDLPLPSSVEQLEIMKNNSSGSGNDRGWHLNARISVFTTSAGS